MPPTRRPKSGSKKSKRSRPHRHSDASLEKWNVPSDIPLDEEDQFHASRDKILLDGEDVEQDFEEDDEVFALKGLEEEESEEEAEYKQDYDETEGVADTQNPELITKSKLSKSKEKKRKKENKETSPSLSEESEEEAWGRKASAYYSSNAAQIESDDEEALELEENEAMRLQAKALDGMDDNDFGLNDPRGENTTETSDPYLTEPPPVILLSLPNDKKSLLRHLEKNNPEALALASDWDDSAQNLFTTRAKLDKLQLENPEALSLGMTHLYYQTLLTYATSLAFYLHLRASENYAQRPDALRTHPIMARLLVLKQGLATLEDLHFAPSDSEEEEFEDDEEDEDIDMDLDEILVNKIGRGRHGRLDPQELSELIKEAFSHQEELANERQVEAQLKPPKKKRKTSKDPSKPSQPIFDLVEPEFKRSEISSKGNTDVSDVYGEALSLQHVDAADKNARRKSLRFYTAKIESASARRQGARRTLSGDDDVPYRERRRANEARMLAEPKDRAKYSLDTTEQESRKASGSDDDEEETGFDGYYDLVKRASKERKEKKKADYETTRATLRPIPDDESTNGPRSLTKAILTNRGLTPHRQKSARNPRVKKRERYDQAKKRVSSRKAVYKGGLSETGGRYEGEKSGISKVVKSVRLA